MTALLYPVCLMNKLHIKSIAFWGACLFLPMIILVTVMIWNGIYPFGPESFLTEDLKYQYIDFYTWFKSVLSGETSLFYVDNQALGSNSWGLYSYYLASPVNLLLVFFDEEHLTDFVIVSTALKLGGVQVASVFYLRRRFSLGRGCAMVLALCFTWSSWTATQMRNPIWLDALVVLPIVCYGCYLLAAGNKWKLLVAAFSMAVFTCWYTAYMVILFASVFVIFEVIVVHYECAPMRIRSVCHKAGIYVGALALSLLITSFTFVPTVVAMLNGAMGSQPPTGVFHCDIPTLFSGFLLGAWILDITPQLYCGMFPLLLLVMFFLMSKISWRVKVVAALFFVFMVAGAYFVPLDYIWCGFRMPNGFYCRMTFLTLFLMLWIGGYTIEKMGERKASLKKIAIAVAVVVLVAVFVYFSGGFVRRRYLILNVGLLVIYGCLLALILGRVNGKPQRRAVVLSCTAILLILTGCELAYNAHLSWGQLYRGYTQERHETYVFETDEQLRELSEFDSSLYRVEKTYTRAGAAALNEGMSHDYLELSSYSSAHNNAAIEFLEALGYSGQGEFSVSYSEPILLSDALLGVKYVSDDSLPMGYFDAGLLQTNDGRRMYQNPYALGLGYGVSQSAGDFAPSESENPFELQNRFVSALLGTDVKVYKQASVSLTEDASGKKTWSVQVPENAVGYTYVHSDTQVYLTVPGEQTKPENNRWNHAVTAIAATGTVPAEVSVSLSADAAARGGGVLSDASYCDFYYLDLDAVHSVCAQLSEQQCTFEKFESGNIEAVFESANDGYLLVSIPQEAGWTVRVNGEEVQCESMAGGALTLVPVVSGSNKITMQYISPGFVAGCSVTLITAAVLAARYLVGKKRRFSKS